MDRRELLVRLADTTRRVMDVTVQTDADDDEVRQALDALEEATRLLSTRVRGAAPARTAEQFAAGDAPYNPVIGVANPYAPPMQVVPLDDGTVEGTVTLRALHEGPPGSVHGGIVATLLDQVLGHAIALADAPGMTIELTTRYRKPTPFLEPLTVRARHDRTDGRKVWASAEIVTADGTVTAEAKGVFLQLSEEHRAKFLELMSQRAG